MKKYFLCISLVVTLILSGGSCSDITNLGSTTVQSPEEWFKQVVVDPIPVSVRHVEGYGEVWQGHNLFLKFQASPNFIEKELVKIHEYQKIDCRGKMMDDLMPSVDYAKSMGFWNITEARKHKNITCYVANKYKNKWTSEGYSQILVDEEVESPKTAETYWTVYFHELGI